ncbi:MAG: aspartate aminotransferase family protein [Thermoanaerobaculales bacterium]|nr:aspartate aminotransferase family protein [Thermoanaerobaculales bacterium]
MTKRHDLEDFREQAHQMVDWMADYLEGGVRDHPVLSRVKPGAVSGALPKSMPESPEELERVWQDFQDIILPGVTHWNHPGFMAYFSITASGPGVLGEMLSAALNVNGMLWRTCPAATELELVVLDWLRRGLNLPQEFFGFLCDTASISSLLALAAAREAAGLDVRERGLAGRDDLPPLRVYASDQAHSSIAKACLTLGFGLQGFRAIPHDKDYRMDVCALRAAINEDRKAGCRPLAVVATVGTTSTTSVDPVAEISALCADEGLWLHVDAAYAGSAALCPEYHWCLEGCENADSFVFNPHKWLFVPIDASALYTRHPDTFKRAFSLVPEYLTTPMAGQVVDLMDYGVQLGRRFRGLKVWWVLRTFGLSGLQAHLRRHIALAQEFATWVDDVEWLERTAPAPFSVVCFRALPSGETDSEAIDSFNMKLMEQVNASGEIFLSHTRLDSGISLRVAIGNLGTEEQDLDLCKKLIMEGMACLSNL